jgi:methyl-accepting chemotaxis protein
MKLLANLSIKMKLLLLALLPLLGLLYFAVSSVQEKWDVAAEIDRIETLSSFAVKASALVHETQKERGATAGFLGSKGASFVSELPAQRNDTDSKAAELRNFLKGFDADVYGNEFVGAMNNAIRQLDGIGSIRSSVSSQTIGAKKAIGYYTQMNAAFLNTIGLGAKIAEQGKIVREITAYINFLQGKERAGVERAVMSNVFARGSFPEGALQRFGSLVTQQDTYISVFSALASVEQKSFYKDRMSGDAAQTVMQMRKVAFEKSAEGDFGVRGTDWFRAATGRINLLKQVEDKLSNDLNTLAENLKSDAEALLAFYAILTAVIITLVVLATATFTRSITQPLKKALVALEDIAEGEGDLTRRLDVSGKDEIARVAQAFNKFTDKMSGVMVEVRSSADSISSGSQQISAGNANLSQRTEEQASSLEETAASMEEMTSTVKQNADSAQQANQLANTARNDAEKGGQVVTRAVDAMGAITDSSTRIADIISTIDAIAFQTNLLALNAAVEAARAGEQGRGFAVVASEVRTLAQRSADAAKEIKGLIEDSVDKVKVGTELVDESGQTLLGIVDGIKKVADIIAEINVASQEQSSGIDQVNNAIAQMDDMTQQNAALVEESAAASRSMQDQANTLTELMAFFKLDQGATGAGVGVYAASQQTAIRDIPAKEVGGNSALADRTQNHLQKLRDEKAETRAKKTGTDGRQEWEDF